MRVIAKFRLWEKAERAPSGYVSKDNPPESEPRVDLKFSAVKDEIFGPYTPAGNLQMTVIKSVGDVFELGTEYYLTFERVEDVTLIDDGHGHVVRTEVAKAEG